MAKGQVVIHTERCKSCGYCIRFCTQQVLAFGKEVNAKGYAFVTPVHPEACVGCASCARMCPDGAIDVYR